MNIKQAKKNAREYNSGYKLSKLAHYSYDSRSWHSHDAIMYSIARNPNATQETLTKIYYHEPRYSYVTRCEVVKRTNNEKIMAQAITIARSRIERSQSEAFLQALCVNVNITNKHIKALIEFRPAFCSPFLAKNECLDNDAVGYILEAMNQFQKWHKYEKIGTIKALYKNSAIKKTTKDMIEILTGISRK